MLESIFDPMQSRFSKEWQKYFNLLYLQQAMNLMQMLLSINLIHQKNYLLIDFIGSIASYYRINYMLKI